MFERIDNVRTNTGGPVNRTSPYDGRKVLMVQSNIIRLFPLALTALAIEAGGRVGVAKVGEKDGKPVYGIFKTQDADKTDGTANDGKKIDKAGKFSSQVAVAQLGEGNVYELGEAKTNEGIEYFELNFVEKVNLPKRKAKAEGTEAATTETTPTAEAQAPATEPTTVAEPAVAAGTEDDEY